MQQTKVKLGQALVTDDDGHWFMIPWGMKNQWEEFLEHLSFALYGDDSSITEPDFPRWAKVIDSPQSLIIFDYEEK